MPDISHPPWPAPAPDHTAALNRWRANRQDATTQPQHIHLDAWAHYRLRFVFAADPWMACGRCGGLSAHLNRFSIAVHIATAESVAYGMLYDALLCAHLEELARSRDELATGDTYFRTPYPLNRPSVNFNRFPRHLMPPMRHRLKHPRFLRAPSSTEKPPWAPKKEYLGNLDEGRLKQDPLFVTLRPSVSLKVGPPPFQGAVRPESALAGRLRSDKRNASVSAVTPSPHLFLEGTGDTNGRLYFLTPFNF